MILDQGDRDSSLHLESAPTISSFARFKLFKTKILNTNKSRSAVLEASLAVSHDVTTLTTKPRYTRCDVSQHK
uniref:Uncharacterized protein n=1 Tax=Daphnia galeata TaxID=27404 RepID=A0A8J2RVA3_9CRUS|nr:unnamed protein product [Daphnia galeata]